MKRFLLTTSILAVCLIFKTGCATQQAVVSRPAYFSAARDQRQAGLSPEDQNRVSTHCAFGMPRLETSWNFGPTDLVAHDGYVLLHSATDKIPVWVSEFVTAAQLTGSLPRRNPFAPDPLLKPGRRSELVDYRGSGLDRGHQAPAGNQTKSQRLKNETFYLSNMAPQAPAMNQQIWRELEDQIRNWMIERGSGYIITGGMFYDPSEEDAANAHGFVRHTVIGPNSVAVPTHFYKIAVAKDNNGLWQSIAFVMENVPHRRPFRFDIYIKSIDWIENRTGIDFMPELIATEEKRLERQASPMWN